jgi:hypothetical protein
MDPRRCYQLKQTYMADLHRQAERDALARAARTPRGTQRFTMKRLFAAVAARHDVQLN